MKKKATQIVIGFSECPLHQSPETFTGPDLWALAQHYLTVMAFCTPSDLLGYYKTDFAVTYEDGSVYEGRLDIQHPSGRCPDHNLVQHIRQLCRQHPNFLDNYELPA